jgi:hypothetical protein
MVDSFKRPQAGPTDESDRRLGRGQEGLGSAGSRILSIPEKGTFTGNSRIEPKVTTCRQIDRGQRRTDHHASTGTAGGQGGDRARIGGNVRRAGIAAAAGFGGGSGHCRQGGRMGDEHPCDSQSHAEKTPEHNFNLPYMLRKIKPAP